MRPLWEQPVTEEYPEIEVNPRVTPTSIVSDVLHLEEISTCIMLRPFCWKGKRDYFYTLYNSEEKHTPVLTI